MSGMRTASKDFGDLVADVTKEIQFEREGKRIGEHMLLKAHEVNDT